MSRESQLGDPMLERAFDPNPWEKRRDLSGMTVVAELDSAFEEQDEYLDLLSMLADFANGGDAEAFREWTQSKIDNLRARRARETRRPA